MLPLRVCHDSHDTYYRAPFGAVPCGTNVCLKIVIRTEKPITKCQLRVWEKDSVARLLPMTISQQDKQDGKGYQQIFTVDYQVPEEPGLVWYYFRILIGERILYYGNNGENLGGEGTLRDYEPPGYQITVFLPSQIPTWFKHGVMYQIFVDRFHSGKDALSPPGGGISPKDNPTKGKGLLHLNWYDTPFYLRDERGGIRRWTFFGGNLAGIMVKLDYLKELGVSILYLNPIFQASSSHKYDTGDYLTIDPMYGDEAIFRQLVQEAAKRGISIILDGVFSHTGSDSIYFNKEGNYPSLGAFQSPESPYYNWYIFQQYPHQYESWWGVDVLPNVNEMEPSYREFIYGGENSVVRHWLKAGARGWRLDVADELPDQFIKELRQALKETDGEGVLIGEVWEDASNKISYGKRREYLWGEELDSTMNYPLRKIWLDFILGKTGASMTYRRIMSLYENYPRENFYAAMNLIGSHDRVRILTLLGEAPREATFTEREKEEYRLEGKARELAVRRLQLLSLMQMTFPGVPCIYYGDEVGLEGYSDPYNRGTYPWGREDRELLTWYQRVIRLRREYQVLIDGAFQSFYQGEDVYGFYRQGVNEQIIVFANRSFSTREGKLPLELVSDISSGKIIALDLLQGTILEETKHGSLQIPPVGARVIYLKQGEESNYRCQGLPKASGILLPITSLPSPWGVGDLGKDAYGFVDFLAAAGQKIWQILPLNPLGPGNSPYQSPSAFAGNELLIDIEQLVQKGLLEPDQVAGELEQLSLRHYDPVKASFAEAAEAKDRLLQKAFFSFPTAPFDRDYFDFQQKNAFWLEDYCLYMALKKELGDIPWYFWDQNIAQREENTLAFYRKTLADEIAYQSFLQYLFATQWQKLKAYANDKGITIIGDLPIYVALDSCDTWANPQLFCLDEQGRPVKIAGVPPDYFSAAGQLWGNPLYNWEGMEKDGYAWWVGRVRYALQLVDYLRLDHFRGFEAYWEVPGEAKTARHGRWLKGPGKRFFEVLFQELGSVPLIVEDLGFLTPEVYNLKHTFRLPGMKVFQFSPEEMLWAEKPNEIFYTGTHDNDTLLSWCEENLERVKTLVVNSTLKTLSVPAQDKRPKVLNELTLCRWVIERLYHSEAPWVIVPLQDVLGLGREARINVPGTVAGNWKWRFHWGMITEEIIVWLRNLARNSGRYQ